ncbi:hypothetical protein GCM10009839_04030 [Catenulispora yoronensis]|uniref:Uncharacterized protein n=1 Tax=Catenulispora yoronensis TaxID=450799 RepID=A0ABP5F4L8_9ACTN
MVRSSDDFTWLGGGRKKTSGKNEESEGRKEKPDPAYRARGDVNGTGPGRRAGLHSHTAEGRAPSEGSKRRMSDVKAT